MGKIYVSDHMLSHSHMHPIWQLFSSNFNSLTVFGFFSHDKINNTKINILSFENSSV